MRRLTSFLALASLVPAPLLAQDADSPKIAYEFEGFGGLGVLPTDIVEADGTSDRIEGIIGAGAEVVVRKNNTRIALGARAETFPIDAAFNRYRLQAEVSQDIPLSNDGRTKLRLGAEYQYVLGEDGRVFDRPRADAQLIHRFGPSHTSLVRLRYGFRNQSEDRFVGFDQDEILLEARHVWRPNGGPASVSVALLASDNDADDDRYSYRGYGIRVIGRAPIGPATEISGRVAYEDRDYEAPFSLAFPVVRADERFQISVGIARRIAPNFELFGDLGYVDNASLIPIRSYSGVIGVGGVRVTLD